MCDLRKGKRHISSKTLGVIYTPEVLSEFMCKNSIETLEKSQ
jgi:hypothetical protein